jgi:hypothetical protein
LKYIIFRFSSVTITLLHPFPTLLLLLLLLLILILIILILLLLLDFFLLEDGVEVGGPLLLHYIGPESPVVRRDFVPLLLCSQESTAPGSVTDLWISC